MIALTALLNEVNGHYMTGLAGPVKPVLVRSNRPATVARKVMRERCRIFLGCVICRELHDGESTTSRRAHALLRLPLPRSYM